MLVTRRRDTEDSHWPFSKYESSRKPASPRMSDHYESPLSTQPGWQGQYPYLGQSEDSSFSFDQSHGSSEPAQPRSMAEAGAPQLDVQVKAEKKSPVAERSAVEPLGLRQARRPSPIAERPEVPEEQYTTKPGALLQEDAALAGGPPRLSSSANPLSSVSPAGMGSEPVARQAGQDECLPALKEEDEEDVEDEEMVEGDIGYLPQTAAERTAARRKMKRFRLTHQQTRFLMSEFAKQPHPDAAHRERLSREIPGLSPRQVQVWFQNRRAKIKRLTADDRDRMVKMRAVPDDFDNIQALHSPYGAVQGIGAPLASPAEFGGQSYADHMMRPLMVDARRPDGDDHISPTGLTPSFGGIGFNPSGTMSSPDLVSPISPNSNERYGYGSQLSTPLSAGSRVPNPFAGRQSSFDTALQMSRQGSRPLQPLHMRDPMARSRSGSLQSPLRSAISWKGDSIDYSTFHETNTNTTLDERQHSGYQPGQVGNASSGGIEGYDSSSYGAGSNLQSSSGLGYSGIQQSPQSRPRLRAASASLPLNLDLRNQYRTSSSGMQSPTINSAGRIPPSTTQYAAPSIYTTSYPSAPLTAPMDFSPPRPSHTRPNAPDFSSSQLSAPIAAPSDFSQASSQGSMPGPATRTPMRDSFSGKPQGYGREQERSEGHSSDTSRPDVLRRERSFPGPSRAIAPASGSEPRPYGRSA